MTLTRKCRKAIEDVLPRHPNGLFNTTSPVNGVQQALVSAGYPEYSPNTIGRALNSSGNIAIKGVWAIDPKSSGFQVRKAYTTVSALNPYEDTDLWTDIGASVKHEIRVLKNKVEPALAAGHVSPRMAVKAQLLEKRALVGQAIDLMDTVPTILAEIEEKQRQYEVVKDVLAEVGVSEEDFLSSIGVTPSGAELSVVTDD